MLSEYRQRFGQFHTDLHREEYLFCSGRKLSFDAAHFFSEFRELFRLSTIGELRVKLEETSEYRETERTSINRLISFAQEHHLVIQVQAISEEIESYEASARIDWDGHKISFQQVADWLRTELPAQEADANRRRDLYARRADVINGAQDLRAERLGKLHSGARELGYENYLAMRRELWGIDYEKLVTSANRILSKTESRYVSTLSPLFLRETNASIDEVTAADLGHLQRYARFDAFFGREQMPRIYRELFAALGFKTETQSNVEIDSAARPNKQQQAFTSPIQIPDEIKLAINFVGGQSNYREFLREAGHTQHFAWTSHNLYPEFQFIGDAATSEAWGMLLENLLLDQSWLTGTLGLVENAEFRHTLAALRLLELRRQAAKIIYETEFYSRKLTGGAGPRYAELMTDAVRVRFDQTEHLREVSIDLRSASFLRAAMFEAQMRDHLKTKFGSRWWTSAKAGEMLIDLWNTGHRYSVEELAAMIGLGELDIECLVQED